jgi:ketosteroid isomerase-like protein
LDIDSRGREVDAMANVSAQVVAERLRDVYVSFDRDAEGALARLVDLYDRDVVFRDPLQTLTGREAVVAMNRRVIARARQLSFDVSDSLGRGDTFFLAWTMKYAPRRGPTFAFEGASHARVRGGVIVEQRDYWDLLSSLAERIPVVRGLYAALAPRLG